MPFLVIARHMPPLSGRPSCSRVTAEPLQRRGAISTATLSLLSRGGFTLECRRGEDVAFAVEMIDANDSKNTFCYHPIQHTLDQGVKLILGHGRSHRLHPRLHLT